MGYVKIHEQLRDWLEAHDLKKTMSGDTVESKENTIIRISGTGYSRIYELPWRYTQVKTSNRDFRILESDTDYHGGFYREERVDDTEFLILVEGELVSREDLQPGDVIATYNPQKTYQYAGGYGNNVLVFLEWLESGFEPYKYFALFQDSLGTSYTGEVFEAYRFVRLGHVEEGGGVA